MIHTPDIRQEATVRVQAESKTFNGCCGILLYLGKKVLHSFMPRNITATVYRCVLLVYGAFVYRCVFNYMKKCICFPLPV